MADIGTIYIRKDLNIGFIPIPKNGSSTIRKHVFNNNLKGNIFNLQSIEKNWIQDVKKIAILRDPIERFASGLVEIQERSESKVIGNLIRPMDPENKVKTVLDKIESGGFIDVHLKPQAKYLKDSNGVSFNVDSFWYLGEMTQNLKKILPSYSGEKTWSRGSKKNNILKIIHENNQLKDRIEYFYQEDIILFEKTKLNK